MSSVPSYDTVKTATLVWSKKSLQRLLKCQQRRQRRLVILNLSEKELDFGTQYCLAVHDIREFIDRNSTSFLRDYRDLIGKVSEGSTNALWWATNTSAKNRSTSNIPVLLTQIEACASLIVENDSNLIIYLPDVSIVPSLEELCDSHNTLLVYSRGYVSYALTKDRVLAGAEHLKFGLRLLYRLLVIRTVLGRKESLRDANMSIALKTFIYENSLARERNYKFVDPMFGRLADFINPREKLIVLVYVLGPYFRTLVKIKKQRALTIVPVENWLSFSDVFKLLAVVLGTRLDRMIPNDLHFRQIAVSKIIQCELFRKYNDLWLDQLACKPIMASFIADTGVSRYIQTFENHPWEKLAIDGLRSAKPTIKITGFQQAAIPESAANYFCSETEIDRISKPDRLLCIGKEPLRVINEFGGKPFPNAEVGCGLRYEYLSILRPQPQKTIKNILVACDGVVNTVPMIDFVASQLKYSDKYEVKFRFHPALPYLKLRKELSVNLREVDHFSISDNASELRDDLLTSDLCIYWGTSVSVEALAMSLPLIFFDPGLPLKNDPLFQCDSLKWRVRATDALEDVIDEINALDSSEFEWQAKNSRKYVDEYFAPVTDEALYKFLE